MNSEEAFALLTAARPAVLDQADLVAGPAEQDRILRQILATAPSAGRHGSRPPARARHGRRWGIAAATATVGIAAVAMLAAAGAFTGTGPAPHPATSGTGHAIDGTALTDRMTKAVSVNTSNDILYTSATFAPGTTMTGTATLKLWTYGPAELEEAYGPNGTPQTFASAVVSHGMRDRTFVDYKTKRWQSDSFPLSRWGGGPADPVSSFVRELLAYGPQPYRRGAPPEKPKIRNVTLPNGEKAIEVTGPTWTYNQHRSPVRLATFADPQFTLGAGGAPRQVTTTTWIDATTYLPIKTQVTAADGMVVTSQVFSWLPATPANLAPLRHPVQAPPGFTHA